MRGKFKKHTGEIVKVDVKDTIVFVDGIQNTKKDGTKTPSPLNPSNLQIIELKMDDKKRRKMIEGENKNVEKAS